MAEFSSLLPSNNRHRARGPKVLSLGAPLGPEIRVPDFFFLNMKVRSVEWSDKVVS